MTNVITLRGNCYIFMLQTNYIMSVVIHTFCALLYLKCSLNMLLNVLAAFFCRNLSKQKPLHNKINAHLHYWTLRLQFCKKDLSYFEFWRLDCVDVMVGLALQCWPWFLFKELSLVLSELGNIIIFTHIVTTTTLLMITTPRYSIFWRYYINIFSQNTDSRQWRAVEHNTSDMMMVPSIASLRSLRVTLTIVITRCILSISCFKNMFSGCKWPIFFSLSFTYGYQNRTP